MVKRWLTPQYDWPGFHLDFFLKIQHVHGQKMIDPPGLWQTRISPRIFFKDSSCPWSKDDWPPRIMTDQDITKNFFKDSTCAWSKDDWPPRIMTDQDLT